MLLVWAAFVLQFSPDSEEIANGRADRQRHVLVPGDGAPARTDARRAERRRHRRRLQPERTELLTTSTDGKLSLWDLASVKLVGACRVPKLDARR
jgi:hypothetical protein